MWCGVSDRYSGDNLRTPKPRIIMGQLTEANTAHKCSHKLNKKAKGEEENQNSYIAQGTSKSDFVSTRNATTMFENALTRYKLAPADGFLLLIKGMIGSFG